MRIGFDATMLVPELRYTGMGEYTWKLLAHLARLDAINEYVLFVYPGQTSMPELAPNFSTLELPRPRLGPFSALASHQWLLPLVARQAELDVFHSPCVTVRPSHPGVPWRMPCPMVVTMHDSIPITFYDGRQGPRLPWKLRTFYRFMLRNLRAAGCIITVSDSARKDILRATGLPPEQVVVIHNGIDFSRAELSEAGKSQLRRKLGLLRPYVLFAGSYEPRKNISGVLNAYAEARKRGLSLDIALLVERESGHAEPVQALVRSFGLGDRIHFLHSLPEDTLRALYTMADAFVYPSFYEGFGFPPLQAMACGIPVIASHVSSLPEVLGDAALFVDPSSPAEISSALLQVTSDAALRARLAEAGPTQAARFSWEKAARATLDIYLRAAQGK